MCDWPSMVNTFQCGLIASKGTIAQDGIDSQVVSSSLPSGTIFTDFCAGSPQIAVNALRVDSAISKGLSRNTSWENPLHAACNSSSVMPSVTVGKGVTNA